MDSIHTWKLTIAGTDRTGLVRPGTLEWTTKEGRELDTLRCVLDDRSAVFGSSITAYSEAVLTADPGTVNEQIVFGGYIIVATPAGDETGQWLSFEVQASGYEVIFDTTPRVRQTWVNEDAGTIATELLTAAGLNVEFDVATYVEAGDTIEVFTADGSEALTKTLDRLCTQAEMMWYVDAEKHVHLADEDSASEHSPFDVIAPGTLADHTASLYEIEAGTLRVKQDASSLVNRLHILGGYALDAVTSDTFAGSDAQEVSIGYAFNLSHQKIRSNVQVFYNDDALVLGTAFVDYFGKALTNGQTVEALVSRINGIVYFPLTTVFDPADEIVVSYQVESRQELTLDASNSASSAASYALFGRYFDGPFDASTITDAAEMARAGEAYLEQYAFPVSTGTFRTLRLGLRAGQSCGITSAKDGLSGRHVLRTVANELLESGYVRVTATFGGRGEKLSNWVGGGGSGGGAGGQGSGGDSGTLPGGGQQGPIQGDAGPLNLIDILTALLPGTTWDPDTGGDATGLVLVPATPNAGGRLLGYDGGVVQAYLDSDGTLMSGGGLVRLGQKGQRLLIDGLRGDGYDLRWLADYADDADYVARIVAELQGVDSKPALILSVIDGGAIAYGAITLDLRASDNLSSLMAFVIRDGVDGPTAWLSGGPLDVGSARITSVADPVADTDALNRQTGDGRYAPLASVILIASQAETEAGTITDKAVPPAWLALRKIGSGWALGTGGNNRGSGAIDLQGGRGANAQVASGTRATVAGGYSNTASGSNATIGGGASNMATQESAVVAGGSSNAVSAAFGAVLGGADNVAAGGNAAVGGGYDNIAEGQYAAIVGGKQAHAGLFGQQAHASGKFSSRGDAQRSDYVLRNATSDDTQTELFLDGVDDRLTLADDTTWFFEARIAARRTDADGESAAYILQGCIDRNAGTVALVGSITKTVLAEDTSAWDVTAEADDTNKALVLKVTGEAGKVIYWVGHVSAVEVTGEVITWRLDFSNADYSAYVALI